MPMPKEGESEKDFVRRCIPIVIADGAAEDGSQANAMCHSMWKAAQKEDTVKNINVKRVKSGLMQIRGTIERAALDEENRTVPILFSSESPVEEWFGMEILDHEKSSIRMDRAKNGLPLLWTHDTSMMAGRVQDITFATDRVGRGIARFGKSPLAEEKYQDVRDGIITDVSVAARRYRTVLQEQGSDGAPNVYRTVDWEPLHVALCATGADPRAGVGRTAEQENWLTIEESIKREVKKMDNKFCPVCGKETANGFCPDGHEPSQAARTVQVTDPPKPPIDLAAIRLEGSKAEAARTTEIMALAERHNCPDLAREAIKAGDSVDVFKTKILETQYKARPVQTSADIGMGQRDLKDWRITRAIVAAMTKDWSKAGLEKEASDTVARQLRAEPQGFYIPFDVMQRSVRGDVQRDLTVGSWTGGGATVATDLLSASFIEMLRNRMMVRRLGATIMGGLTGDIAIPGQATSATSYWVAEGVAPTESQQAVTQIGLTPKTVGAFTDISRKLLIQGSIDAEAFVRNDLAQVNALAIDLAAINGRGVGGQPLGLLNRVAPTGTVNIIAMGVNGAACTFVAIVGMESAIAQANADVGSMAYLTCAVQAGTLKTLLKNAAAATFVWENNSMNGYPAYVSNQVPSNLQKGTGSNLRAILFGVWSQLLIGEWGTVDVLVDPYTGGAAGTVRVRILQSVDIAVRHEASFCVIKDCV